METVEKKLDGIILPLPFADVSDGIGLGRLLGVTSHELAGCPKDIVVNVAVPKSKELAKTVIYWLDNCPEGNSPWSKKACAFWLIQKFSNFHEYDRLAVRVRPSEPKEDNTYQEYDFIFWARGKPVTIGHQYDIGSNINKMLGEGRSLRDVVGAWQQKDYDLKFGRPIGDFEAEIDKILEDVPMVKMIDTKRNLEIDARNAGWHSLYPLVESVI